MKKKKKECELCKAEKLTHWYYEDDLIWIADCKTCKCPMTVLRKHHKTFTNEEKFYIIDKIMELFGRTAYKYIDWNMKTIKNHAHCHLRGKKYHCSKIQKRKL
ncbi:MAG: hypothetical protein KAW92_09625 [Candidatus Cloacimonetes bacterium]|nr:hypothetical protein [Candidatus Cloacimonadota bacterium]